MNELIKVYSHPRSGTNLLMKSLNINFYDGIDLSTKGQMGHWNSREPIECDSGKLFGNHLFYTNDNGSKIYIYRDCRDVIISLWKSRNFINLDYHNKLDLYDFLNYKLDWMGSPSQKCEPSLTVTEHWYNHVNTWMVDYKDCFFVRYEDLVLNYEKTILDISEHFNLKRPKEIKTVNSLVGPSPNKGNVGEWKNHFTDKCLDLFYSKLESNKYLYGDFVSTYESV